LSGPPHNTESSRSCSRSLAIAVASSLLAAPAICAATADATPLKPVALVDYTPALCMGPSISPVEVYVDLVSGTSRATAVRLERRYRPRAGATLTLGGKRYPLSPNAPHGSVYTDRITWDFRPIKVSATRGEHAVGKALTLRYTSASGKKTVHGTLLAVGCTH
jgi:hypothetical protein